MRQSLAELDVVVVVAVDNVGDEAGSSSPGLYPHPSHYHFDVCVHQSPSCHLDWRLARELG